MSPRAIKRVGGDASKLVRDDVPPVQISGYIVLNIGDQRFTLEGSVGSAIIVEFHRSFDDAVPVGTIPEIAGAVGSAFGLNGDDFKKEVTDRINSIPIPAVATALNTLVIKITDLAINTSTNVYQFGFCCDLSAANIEAGGVKLGGFGLRITYTNTKPPTS